MYETRANRAETRQNAEFIRPMLSHFYDKQPLVEPKVELEFLQSLMGQFNAGIISQAAQRLWDKNNLVLVYSGPEKEGIATPTAEQLLQVMAQVEASEIAAPAGEEIPEAFLDPAKLKGSAIKKAGTTIYGATEWTLKNGVKVVVYPTDLTKDQILFSLYKDGGLSLVASEDIATFDNSILRVFTNNCGVSSFKNTVVSKMLTGKNLSVTPYAERLEHGISGQSTVKDLETALQLTYLYFTEPRFDPEEWSTSIDQIASVLPNMLNQPNYKFQKEMYKTLYSDNPRRQALSPETLEKADLKVLEKYWKKLFADAAGATFVVVGDVNPEALKPLVEKYIGSLPKGRKALKWVNTHEDIVSGKVANVFETDMQTPKSTVLQVWSANTSFTTEKDAALDAIDYIMDMRYTNSLREEEGGTYGASAVGMISRRPEPRMLFQVYFDCKPALCDKLRALAVSGLEDLAQAGPTDDELNAAKLNLLKNIPEKRQRNNYWKNAIETYLRYGVDEDAAYEAAVNALTKESIQATLKELIQSGNFAEVVMKPAVTAEAE